MLLERDRKLYFIFSVISIALSFIACIPFSLSRVTLFEIIVKYMVFPLAIGVFTLLMFAGKYRSYRPAVKYTTVVSYVPLFSYTAAIIFNTLVLVLRNTLVYSDLKNNLLIIGLSLLLIVVLIFSQAINRLVMIFSKNEAMLADAIFCILALAYTIGGCKLAFEFRAFGGFETKNVFFILIPVFLGLAAAILHILNIKLVQDTNQEYVLHKREEFVEQWENNLQDTKEIYNEARTEILESLLDYNLGELGFVEDTAEAVEEETEAISNEEMDALKESNKNLEAQVSTLKNQNQELQQKLDEALASIAESKDKIVDTLQKCSDNDADLIKDSLQHSLDVLVHEREVIKETRAKVTADLEEKRAVLQAKIDEHEEKLRQEEQERLEKEEKARLDALRRAQEALEREKEKKPIVPAFEEFIEFATAIGNGRDDMEVSFNDKQTQYKFACAGNNFLTLQKTNNDYRISFFAMTDDMRTLLYDYNGIITFDKQVDYEKSKASLNVLKAVYKGDDTLSYETLQGLMKASLDILLDAESKEAEAIAAEKAAKERAKLAEKVLREREKELAKQAEEAEKAA